MVTFIHRYIIVLLIMLPSVGLTVDKIPAEQKIDDRVLRLPENYTTGTEKKCVTICKRWGEKCVLISKGTPTVSSSGVVTGGGGVERKCRRVCEALGEECF